MAQVHLRGPRCTDEGTTVECTGKVAGLGGTTFEIRISATGIALRRMLPH